ncbi:MAG: hypothetical protein RIC55_21525 [Pirellulaceae bacterium]
MEMSVLFVSDAARELDARPRDISDLFYQRVLDDQRCPVVSNRRVIPRDYLPKIREALAQRRQAKQGAAQ